MFMVSRKVSFWITFSSPLFILQVTVHVPEPARTVEERPHQASRRTTNRRNAGQSSRGTRRAPYSTRAAAAIDVESAEEEAAATSSDTEEEDEEDEWSESSRYVRE